MATIKPIEGSSVHQIQSGQVIVDLCSVVKELVENALDASATSLEVRFKNNGLDSIEVADNGTGIGPEDFASIALKHYTSKLSTYDDLGSLTTFGFRGEALSSLCALSKLSVVTSRQQDAPKGSRLEFETSGRLKSTAVVAAQRGTTVTVDNIFHNLPVRRKELEKNIKREYGKVLGLLHAYACVSTGVRFSVSNVPRKGKKVVVFSTKNNPTTRENIANVYGAKTLLALTPLDLSLELRPTAPSIQLAKGWNPTKDVIREVRLEGHISRPVVGEGRQTPDRQMFFVNSRPCALPQVSKAINDVYKAYNITQSPFIFADLKIDTNAYDVNVSPDKRTILLHDQAALLDAIKDGLVELFENQEQSVPQAGNRGLKHLPPFKQLSVERPLRNASEEKEVSDAEVLSESNVRVSALSTSRLLDKAGQEIEMREHVAKPVTAELPVEEMQEVQLQTNGSSHANSDKPGQSAPDEENSAEERTIEPTADLEEGQYELPRPVRDFNKRMGLDIVGRKARQFSDSAEESEGKSDSEDDLQPVHIATSKESIPSVSKTPKTAVPGDVPNAFDRMRPKRVAEDTATVTIGNQTTSMAIRSPEKKKRRTDMPKVINVGDKAMPSFVSSLSLFTAPGVEATAGEDDVIQENRSATNMNDRMRRRSTARENAQPLPSTTTKNSQTTSPEDDISDHVPPSPISVSASEAGSDDEYLDEREQKAREEARIAELIEAAEETAARPSSDNIKRATNVLKGRGRKYSTLQLLQRLKTSEQCIERQLRQLTKATTLHEAENHEALHDAQDEQNATSVEERLSLTVTKSDFGRMRVIGQFNLGFILVSRPAVARKDSGNDELFIIDQHASDEKYNFERLQSQTVVQNQRLVHPKQLDLTAIEEEIILNHGAALEKNGFEISTDTSGNSPVGQRCKLVSLPMSREVTFSLSDLEELLALLAEHSENARGDVPRPSKVRKMFAMRACRSSIMVGKTLTNKQMEKVVRHMGELDKPWNCPHGRPTMRHLFSVRGFRQWQEGDGLVDMDEVTSIGGPSKDVDWKAFVRSGEEMGMLYKADNVKL
ncbi:uncharacterized protein PV09_08334 [Verruconis gallopava]|uniref:DNA mismatch repair protein PMS1 n=1 Tax=Verruconis gallopava TaxID=253628 RepID=A0A0D2A0I8_9PEZI|nr:uncharacterized protein PV09_08334 [Verruconis gallopava]KIW00158.1 hypothetical protein PV09_08334 [Verruconis gallopava]